MERAVPGLTRVTFTNLEKVLYRDQGITKAKVIEYYIRIAPRILPFLKDRPVVLNRFPEGIDRQGFYEKDAPGGTPEWVEIFTRYSETADRDVHYIVCNTLDTLLWLANLAALEINIPLSRTISYDTPDMVFLDLDPEPPLRFPDVTRIAMLLREHLISIGLYCYVKTSGKKGIHAVIPVLPEYTFRQTRDFAHRIGREIAAMDSLVVSEFPHSRDPGTVFVDYLQNARGKTMICPYSLRAVSGAPASTPVTWDELGGGATPEGYNILNVPSRKENPWAKILEDRQKLPEEYL
ncbi:MAG: non-homologous end-joining DNA ligase [Methanoregulaceae archaeon]|nr:non-homologous end-joining DNA ligase [Methanoregulaceae archaeon]